MITTRWKRLINKQSHIKEQQLEDLSRLPLLCYSTSNFSQFYHCNRCIGNIRNKSYQTLQNHITSPLTNAQSAAMYEYCFV